MSPNWSITPQSWNPFIPFTHWAWTLIRNTSLSNWSAGTTTSYNCRLLIIIVVSWTKIKSFHFNFISLSFHIKDSIHRDFDVIWSECSSIDIAFLVFYPVSPVDCETYERPWLITSASRLVEPNLWNSLIHVAWVVMKLFISSMHEWHYSISLCFTLALWLDVSSTCSSSVWYHHSTLLSCGQHVLKKQTHS